MMESTGDKIRELTKGLNEKELELVKQVLSILKVGIKGVN